MYNIIEIHQDDAEANNTSKLVFCYQKKKLIENVFLTCIPKENQKQYIDKYEYAHNIYIKKLTFKKRSCSMKYEYCYFKTLREKP